MSQLSAIPPGLRSAAVSRAAVLAAVFAAFAGATPPSHAHSGSSLLAARRGAAPSPGLREGDFAWAVAMHVHGSFSEGDGSYEWHTNLADLAGVDVIWWSEHDWRSWHEQYTTKYDFESAVYEPQFGRWSEPDDAFGGEYRYWQRSGAAQVLFTTSIDSTQAYQGNRCFSFEADDPQTTNFFRVVYFQQEGSNKQSKYSLAHRVQIQFAFLPVLLDANDSKFVMEAGLSWHPSGKHVLRYVAGSMDGEGAHSIPIPYTPGPWNVATLDVTADAIAHFTSGGADSVRGEDNNLFRLRMGLEVRNNSTAKVLFDDFRYVVDPTLTRADYLAKQQEFTDFYESQTPALQQIVGTELSKFRAQPHMNGFTPTPMTVDYGNHVWSDTLYYAVDQIHAVGGAVSLNHMFGSGVYGDLNETAEQKAQRVRNMKVGLLISKAYRADLLEVGYRWRGGIVLEDHLDTWDTLTSHGLYLTGNGVNDSHGFEPFHGWNPWIQHASYENNFVTWLYAPSISETQFIDAMFAGRAFFGDPHVFGGALDLASGEGIPMGRVAYTDRSSHSLIVALEPVDDDVQVRLLQGEIRPNVPVNQYLNVNWLRDEILDAAVVGGAFVDTVTLDTTLPSFARVEVTGAAGEPMAYSNPIHFVREFPAAGIPAARVAGVIGPVVVRSAKKFAWKSAQYDSAAAQLTLGGDELPAGSGEIVIDVGTLGAPGGVTGAASSSFENGILTLAGFEGAGSTIRVFWGAVGVAAGGRPVTELRLGPGRPNPFAEAGISCEISLPAAGPIRLDVLDVRGRLVRVIEEGERAAGVHRLLWDGEDGRGESVASGVYFLRLRADGRALTSKAVKTR